MARWMPDGGVVNHPLFNAAVYATAALIEVLDYRASRRVVPGELEHVDELTPADYAPDGGNLPDDGHAVPRRPVDLFGPAGENAPTLREPLVDDRP